MSSQSFIQSRERGKVGQHLLAEIIRGWNVGVEEIPDGYFPDYDLKLSTGKTIEVKVDEMAQTTGNICLELSALDHSKADVLAICYGKPISGIYLTPLSKARDYAHRWQVKKKVGEFKLDAAIVPRRIFLEQLQPEVISLMH